MKKRILYIILGVMLLSVKGVGQTASISISGNTSYTYNGSPQFDLLSTNISVSGGCSQSSLPTYIYSGSDFSGNSYNSSTAPTNAGNYQIIASATFSCGTFSSNIISFTIGKATPTITVTPGTYTYNGSPQGPGVTETTTGGSTSVPTFSYVGTSGTTYGPLTTKPTNAGSYQVTASVITDANYLAASSSATTFTIGKKVLTITAEDKSKLYGAAIPSLTFIYAGLVNGDVAPSTLPAISTTAVLGSAAGTYPISVSSAADANYTINYVAGTLTVTKVPLIITADNKTKVYGAANPILTYTYSGLVNGDLATATWPTILTTAVANFPAGTYPIIPSAATDANYTITYVEGTLTVTKAPLTITAKPHTITYNGTAYTGGNGVVATGLISGETISNLTGTLTYAGTSQGAKNVGTYTIIPDGLSSPNYNINYVGDNLEIKKATLNVIAGDQSVNFGTETAKILNDAVSTYTGFVGGDNASAITGSVTYSTNYTPLTSTGASGIYLEPIITGLTATNYDIIAVKGNITITAPPSSPVFQIPNAFVPGSTNEFDNKFRIFANSAFAPDLLTGFSIFNRNGQLIKKFTGITDSWDGRGLDGNLLEADVYLWAASFKVDPLTTSPPRTGTFILLK